MEKALGRKFTKEKGIVCIKNESKLRQIKTPLSVIKPMHAKWLIDFPCFKSFILHLSYRWRSIIKHALRLVFSSNLFRIHEIKPAQNLAKLVIRRIKFVWNKRTYCLRSWIYIKLIHLRQNANEIRIFFSIWIFFHEHSQITGLQGKGEGISLTSDYHFHPLHRYLDISRAITAGSSPLHVASSRARTGNLWFPSASR